MNRYPGIQPFERNQSHLFKGREEEKQELLDLIALHPLVVLFAKSGIGKTSLLQAGIAPEMPDEQLLPVFIRLNRTDTDASPEKQVYQILREQKYLSQDTPDNLSLWEYLKKARFVQAGEACTPVLIFDQFEELFTLYDEEKRKRFVTEFADVVNKRMPDSVREWFDRDADSLPPRQVAQYERPLNVKVVLSIRSDMLSFLDQLSRPIPSILRCRYELKSLSRANAEKAIVEPAAAKGEFDTPPFTYSDFALHEILDFLQSRDTDTDDATTTDTRLIESFQLQLLCSRIEDKLPEKDTSENIVIHTDDYGHRIGLQKIINDFYHDTIQSFPPHRRLNIQRAIEEDLIRNERRISMAASVLKDRNITNSELQKLVDKKIVRKEARLNDAYYEISHDNLVLPIVESYVARKNEEERINMENKLLQEQTKYREEQRFRNYAIALLAITIIGLTLSAWVLIMQRNNALRMEEKVERVNAFIEAEKSDLSARNDSLLSDLITERRKISTNDEFYAGRYALIYTGEEYIFVGKNIDSATYRYTSAKPFDEYTGFAKVKKPDGVDYLLDTLGNEYRKINSKKDLDSLTKAIDMSGLGLDNIKFGPNVVDIQLLLLSENNFSKFPEGIEYFSSLKLVDLSYNDSIKNIPNTINNLIKLEKIDLSGNQLSYLPNSLMYLQNLKILKLRDNKFDILPDAVLNFKKLKELDMSSNKIAIMPNKIGNLTELQYLNLRVNDIINIPYTIGNLDKLQILDLRHNDIEKLPFEITKLINLKSLDLSFNKIPYQERQKIKKLLPNCKIHF